MQHVRDEAHRFALTYHRKLRAKRVVSSKLDALKGLGAKRRKILIDHFGSFDKIKKASLDDILSVSGIPEKLARTVYDFVRSDGKVAESPLDEDAEKPGASTEVLDEIAEEQDEIGEPEELSEELDTEELDTEEQEAEELDAKDNRQEG
jgi:NAD-dependent DNA ligase